MERKKPLERISVNRLKKNMLGIDAILVAN